MSEPFLGEIRMFAGNFAPRGWAFCYGQLLSIAQNSALFAILGTTYGGNGTTTFALPDLRGRVPIGTGAGPGLTPRSLGELSGQENVTLTAQQMPSHAHAAQCSSGNGNSNAPAGKLWSKDAGVQSATYTSSAPDGTMAGTAIASAGGSQPHNNMQPYLGMSYIIALQGIFPSRN
jgi:microcystin-dependent protein